VDTGQQNASLRVESNVDDDLDEDVDKESPFDPIIIPPPTPISPIVFLDILNSDSEFDQDSDDSMCGRDEPYRRLLGEITSHINEVEKAQYLNRLEVPLLRAPQIHLLEHFAVFRPHLFQRKLHMDPPIFDHIINQIRKHEIFDSHGKNLQLLVSVQLVIFLNHTGHYGNTISPEDVAQWGGVSVGSVINCMHCVMVALLGQHNKFLQMPGVSEDAELVCMFVEGRTYPGWWNGIFAADGSAIPLFQKPGYFGKIFYDRKSTYLMNCQIRTV
jgi:hypothetical protein